jgi:hypothetical protein
MNAALKIVTRLPLQELWRNDGFATTSQIRSLKAEEIVGLLRVGRVQFVIADVGTLPQWITPAEGYDFWKSEAEPHFADPELRVNLDKFPGGYCYFASEWSSDDKTIPVVVCEKHH